MSDWFYLPFLYAAYAAFFCLLWILQRRSQNATSVDIFWAMGVAVGAWAHFIQSGAVVSERSLFALSAISYWALRLSWHLYRDRLHKEEDARYNRYRNRWGVNAQRNFFILYQVQGALSFLISLSVIPVFYSDTPWLSISDLVGIAIFVLAIWGESLSDRQLKDFKSKPENRGKTMTAGLWRYSRHPNYFFEWMHWFTYLALSWPLFQFYGLELLAPVLMYLLLTKFSGIPIAEEQSMISRGEDYRRYQQQTNAFFPWFPRR